MTKVVYFVDRLLWGGIQSLLFDIATHIDKTKIQLDVLTLDDGNHYELEDTLSKMGIRVYKLNGIWLSKISQVIPYFKAIRNFFKEHKGEYNAIHMNSSNKNVFILYYAKKYGVPIRIAHSHSSNYKNPGIIPKIAGLFLKYVLKKNTNYFFACSEQSSRWMFGNEYFENGKVEIIKNSIATKDFLFDDKVRQKFRKKLNAENKIVYGFIGRFSYMKNHKFLIQVFSEILKLQNNAMLILIGTGELEKEIKELVGKMNIKDSVRLLGFQHNRNLWLSAMDCFIMTSTYEGAPVSLIEAQAASLISFVSREAVQDSSKISDLVRFISLKKSPAEWAKLITTTKFPERINMQDVVKKAGYDIDESVKFLEKVYAGNAPK